MSQVMLLVGTRKGGFILKSDGERKEWAIEGPFLKGWEVSDITRDDRGETPVFWAAVNHFVYGPTIHKSTDGGTTWTQMEKGPAYEKD